MSGGIDGIGFNRATTPQEVETHQSQHAAVIVQSHGQQVQTQPSISSLVQDAQEEAGMLLQDKSSDKLSKREARSKTGSRVQEAIEKYLKGISGVNHAEKFEKLADQLKKMGEATPDQIRELIQEFKENSDDANLESAVLLALEELFSADAANPQLLASIREVKSELGTELREFYEKQVKTYEDISEVYDQLLGEYGEADFLTATETLISRLGDDLQAQGSRVEPGKVKSTVDSLYHLEVARNTFSAMSGLVEKMQSTFNVSL